MLLKLWFHSTSVVFAYFSTYLHHTFIPSEAWNACLADFKLTFYQIISSAPSIFNKQNQFFIHHTLWKQRNIYLLIFSPVKVYYKEMFLTQNYNQDFKP